MKPTPNVRFPWSVAGLALAGLAMLLWGCGHTREILSPPRKVSPPRTVKSRMIRPKLDPIDPTIPTLQQPQAQPLVTPPTAIDVPIIDRNGS